MTENYILKTTDHHQIDITTYGNSNLEKGSCIIFVHGFKGFKDWGFGPYLGRYFADRGYFLISFNFSHNGVAANSVDFTELDKFAENTYSLEIAEIEEIVKAYINGFFGTPNQNAKIGLLGHSRGGGDSIIASSLINEITALTTWSAISKFDRWTSRQKEDWRKTGFLEIMNARTKQMMRLNHTLLEDIENNSSELLNIELALNNMQKPYLIVHGDQDLAVPIDEAEQIYSWTNKNYTEFFKISGTGHTFDIKHPFEDSSVAFEKVLEKTNHFFNKYLNG